MHQPKLIKCIALLLLLLSTQTVFANAIDGLRTDKDVLKFVSKLHKSFTSEKKAQISIIPSNELLNKVGFGVIGRQLGIRTWEKADFNEDCKTDLLITVMWNVNQALTLFAIIDNGNNTYKLINVIKNPLYGYQMAKPTIIKQKQVLIYCNEENIYSKKLGNESRCRFDTLIYKFGNFIEFNSNHGNYNISSIHFETTGCLGECPVFALDIPVNGLATYNAIAFNSQRGIFKTQIDPQKLSDIYNVVNYLKIRQLKDKYRVDWTDDQTIKLKFEFNNGYVKTISDYGAQGTFGLFYLYDLLFNLRKSEAWK